MSSSSSSSGGGGSAAIASRDGFSLFRFLPRVRMHPQVRDSWRSLIPEAYNILRPGNMIVGLEGALLTEASVVKPAQRSWRMPW